MRGRRNESARAGRDNPQEKRRESVSSLVQPCPYCQGTGLIESNDYIVMKIRAGLLDLFADGYDNAVIDCNVDIAEYIFAKKCLKNDVEKSGPTSGCT